MYSSGWQRCFLEYISFTHFSLVITYLYTLGKQEVISYVDKKFIIIDETYVFPSVFAAV